MAPLLLFLRLISLCKVIRACPDIEGIFLRSGEHAETISVSGYAEDTALHLREGNHIPTDLDILDTFSRVYGLTTNRNKSIVSVLGPFDPGRVVQYHVLSFLGPNEQYRYLGVQVGQGDTTESNWNHCSNSFTLDSLWLVNRLKLWSRGHA